MEHQGGEGTRRITFEVSTETPLPTGEQIFVTGNHPTIGDWQPNGLALTRMDDKAWATSVLVPGDLRLEYKITRGSWRTEEAMDDQSTPANHVIESGADRRVQHGVRKWKDVGPGPVPQITGDYRVHPGFHSHFLRFDRKIIVWLPPSYGSDSTRRYPVLYMQDGQQVFDPQTSTWQQDWQVDETCTRLIAEARLREVIVVAIYSTEDRFIEYNPSMAGPEYARFLLEELKPFIDSEYRTEPGRETTAVAGASMGGTISFYLVWTRPDVFFGAACLSPAFRFRSDQRSFDIVKQGESLPSLKLFLYGGEGDSTEQELLSGMMDLVKLLKSRGFGEGANLLIRTDPEGEHNEASWAEHTEEWLLFLFGR